MEDEDTSGKRRYSKRAVSATATTTEAIPPLKIKERLHQISVATFNGDEKRVAELKQGLPVRPLKGRNQTPLGNNNNNAAPRVNQKNKRKLKLHTQTEDPYPLTPMNYVAKFSTRPNHDHSTLRHNWAHGRYFPRNFPAASLTVREPRCSVSVYRTGEIGLAGCKTRDAAILAAHLVDDKLAEAAVDEIRVKCFSTVNITTSFAFGVPINLQRLYEHFAYDHPEPDIHVNFDPDVIGSLQFRKTDYAAIDRAHAAKLERARRKAEESGVFVATTVAMIPQQQQPRKEISAHKKRKKRNKKRAGAAITTTPRKKTKLTADESTKSTNEDDDEADEDFEMTINFFPTGRGCTIGSKTDEDVENVKLVVQEIEKLVKGWHQESLDHENKQTNK